eukprot:SAG11_NODE_64_length_18817_cov_64.238327_14_plen_69_part_00
MAYAEDANLGSSVTAPAAVELSWAARDLAPPTGLLRNCLRAGDAGPSEFLAASAPMAGTECAVTTGSE